MTTVSQDTVSQNAVSQDAAPPLETKEQLGDFSLSEARHIVGDFFTPKGQAIPIPVMTTSCMTSTLGIFGRRAAGEWASHIVYQT